jgi:hypothetical protein
MENGNGVTKADLKAALTEFKVELKTELKAELRVELKADWTEAVQTMGDDLTERMRQIETNLLTEFHRYGKGRQLRLHTIESLESRRPPTF